VEFQSLCDRILDREASLVGLWIARDATYRDTVREFEDSCVASKAQAPEAFPWSYPMLPQTFSARALRQVEDHHRVRADEFRHRTVLRADAQEVPGFGTVESYVVSNETHTFPGSASWPALRLVLGPTPEGPRLLRVDVPCANCRAAGGPEGCGFADDLSGERCTGGWLFGGGARIPLGRPTNTERCLRPEDARWHPWFDG
jgi:hypothetical protein